MTGAALGRRTAADAMTEPVIVEASATIQHASAAMLAANTEAAIVMDRRKVRGIVAAEDVARALSDGRDVTKTAVLEIVDPDPVVARGDESLAEVHLRMRRAQRAWAIVTGSGVPLGLLSDPEAAP